MKKIILLALTALIMVGCINSQKEYPSEPIGDGLFHAVVVDSCEYICLPKQNQRSMFAHKGNCRFCKERRQKELEELVIKLKEK